MQVLKMSHLSYEGQSGLDYCVECSLKHGQTAKVLMREAIQRAESDSPQAEGVKEKVRGVVEELSGMEDDTDTVLDNENVRRLNQRARELRKYIYSTQAEIGGAKLETLREIKSRIDSLVTETYRVREEEEECPECIVLEDSLLEEEKPLAPKTPVGEYGKAASEKRRRLLEEIQAEANA